MSAETLYEHPLNAQVRVYLRLEYLLTQVRNTSSLTEAPQWQVFFKNLFDVIDILEHSQVKRDLLKDLEKQRDRLEAWLQVPDVDTDQLRALVKESQQLQHALLDSPRPGLFFSKDKFLAAIRQRFALPGGTCSFDLPVLHHWLNLPLEKRQADVLTWRRSLMPLENALNFWLRIIRASAPMQSCSVNNGFYQQDTNTEDASLLRVKIAQAYNAFPLISGHRTRFAIRLMPFDEEKEIAPDIAVSLAICS